ncbi:MAG: cbb3-type cytochrome c oxidase N-terminal domain-containing protein [Terrimicrobiaceae bacterium]|nr:cbb3-type cytochrome c oxidase N-terminal domain-containing protein [Terrimicrobiaceae bacterium]
MNHPQPDDEALRPHSYDGIQEYDKRLPNWWLFTLYGAIIFSAGYWAYFHWTEHMRPGWVRVQSEIESISLAALAKGGAPTGEQLFGFSKDPAIVAAGEKTFMANCAACHGTDLHGGIGQNLVDATWIHGGTPTDIFNLIRTGVADKGMPTWGPLLGQQRIAEVTAFIISKNSTIEKP